MATLIEILTGHVEYSSSWAVYAEALEPESPARMGQTQFENGGLLDSKQYVIDGVTLGDAKLRYFEDNYSENDREEAEDDLSPLYPEFLEWLVDEGYIDWSDEDEDEINPDTADLKPWQYVMYVMGTPENNFEWHQHYWLKAAGESAPWRDETGREESDGLVLAPEGELAIKDLETARLYMAERAKENLVKIIFID